MEHSMRAKGTWRWPAIGVVSLAACGRVSGSQQPTSQGPPAALTPDPSVAATTPPVQSSSPSSPAPAIVGEWVGTHDCERILAILRAAGLDEFVADAVYGNGLVPGASPEADLDDPAHPCAGAVPRAHSHVFTADGRFTSRDFNGQQVDDGTYVVQGDDIVVINRVPFGFRVVGDELTLVPKPVDISACTTKECRFTATWVLMVAMPGTSWTMGTIPG
jgi:hypothetical protein